MNYYFIGGVTKPHGRNLLNCNHRFFDYFLVTKQFEPLGYLLSLSCWTLYNLNVLGSVVTAPFAAAIVSNSRCFIFNFYFLECAHESRHKWMLNSCVNACLSEYTVLRSWLQVCVFIGNEKMRRKSISSFPFFPLYIIGVYCNCIILSLYHGHFIILSWMLLSRVYCFIDWVPKKFK